jgi:Immunity protein 53
MSTLERLQGWFIRHCDGEREHRYGISIESCDNPGWWVKIDLTGTPLAKRRFPAIAEHVNSSGVQLGPRWMQCRVEDGIWHGAGDETALERIVAIFLEWAEGPTTMP